MKRCTRDRTLIALLCAQIQITARIKKSRSNDARNLPRGAFGLNQLSLNGRVHGHR